MNLKAARVTVWLLGFLALLSSALPVNARDSRRCQFGVPERLRAVVASAKDGVASVRAFDEENVGIGAGIKAKWPDGLVLAEVLPDGPAEEAGLRDGDAILCVADGSTEPYYDVSRFSRDLVVLMVRGKAGTQVLLKVKRRGKVMHVVVTRRAVVLPGGS